jgi:HlyD family secretion protein
MNNSTHARAASRARLVERLVIALVVLGVGGFAVWHYTRPQPIAVALGQVDRGTVQRSVTNTRAGTVNACRRAKLAPQVGGQIVSLPIREGQRVRAGDTMLELWNEDSAAQARLAQEQAKSAKLHAEEACEAAANAEREGARAGKLHAEGLIPDEQFDHSTSTAKSLRASCSVAQGQIAETQRQLELIEANQKRTLLKAPFSGVVAKINTELGEVAMPSPPGIPTPPAIDLIDDSCLYVTAPIDEVDASRIRVGQAGNISLDAYRGKRFPGRVRRIAPYVVDIEKQARTVDVEVEFADGNDVQALLVGYSADVEIVQEAHTGVVRVPTQAIQEGNRVLVYDAASGTLAERKIETGLANYEFTEVRSGLQPGERVAISADRSGVVAGARVTPAPEVTER